MDFVKNVGKYPVFYQEGHGEGDDSNGQHSAVHANGHKIEKLEGAFAPNCISELSLEESCLSNTDGCQNQQNSITERLVDQEKVIQYSTLSPEEKEKKTRIKLEQGGQAQPSGKERTVMPYASLAAIHENTTGQITRNLQSAIKDLGINNATTRWNEVFDATTMIRRIAKYQPEQIKNSLNELIERLARHMRSNQLLLVNSVLTTIKELALSQKSDFKATLNQISTFQSPAESLSNVLIGSIINAGNSKNSFIKDSVFATLEQIKSATGETDTEWIKRIVEFVENDLQLHAAKKNREHSGLKLMSKKGSADMIKRLLVTDEINVSEKKEVFSLLQRFVDNENHLECKTQQTSLRAIRSHLVQPNA